MLAIIVNLHASYDGASLPDRRVDLYRAIVRLQLGDRPLAKKIDLLLPLQDSQRVLQQLALFMVQGTLSRIEERSLLVQLQKGLDFLNSTVENAEFLKQMEEVSELLVKVDHEYEFAHRHFQSYLSACEIIDTNQESLLLANWQETEWKDTILMYASLANTTQFITNLLRFKQQAARDLAYECFKCLKAANRRIDPNLEQAIIALESTVETSLYQQLETFLQNGQWKEADEETNRLMLQIAGKEADQWLDVKDIKNFPCEDLRRIDKLWVDYSKGKFGFSVQKKVWMACGGVPEKFDNDVYKKFADQVGWRRSGNWLSYKDLTFLLEGSKHAHLPKGIWEGENFWREKLLELGVFAGAEVSLFSRKDL
jgi:predicted NACHT family NTPase